MSVGHLIGGYELGRRDRLAGVPRRADSGGFDPESYRLGWIEGRLDQTELLFPKGRGRPAVAQSTIAARNAR